MKLKASLFRSEPGLSNLQIFVITNTVFNPSCPGKPFIQTVTVKDCFLSGNDKLFTAGEKKQKKLQVSLKRLCPVE